MEHRGISLKRMAAWLIPLLFAVLGVVFYCFVSGCGFLGIVFWGVALIAVGFCLLELWERRSRKAAKAVRAGVSILLIVALIAVAVTLVPILRGPTAVKGRSDYVLVLGAGVRGSEPSEILQDRIDQAYSYLSKNPDVICVATGGKGSDENISEAQCIYDHLVAMGIDGSRIWLEEQATSTIENFNYSITLIQEKTGTVPQSVTILSNEFHLFRAGWMAADCGLEADFIAAPTSNGWIRVSYTIREVFAFWKYLLVGG